MKYILKFLLIVVLVALTACSGDKENTNNTNSGKEAGSKNKISYWFNEEATTVEEKAQQKIAKFIVEEMGLVSNIPSNILTDEVLQQYHMTPVVSDGHIGRFLLEQSDSVIVEQTSKGTYQIEIQVLTDIHDTFKEMINDMSEGNRKIVNYIYNEKALEEFNMDVSNIDIIWLSPNKRARNTEYRMGEAAKIYVYKDSYNENKQKWLKKDKNGPYLQELRFKEYQLYPLIGNLEHHYEVGQTVNFDNVLVTIDNMEFVDSDRNKIDNVGNSDDYFLYISWTVQNNRNEKIRVVDHEAIAITNYKNDSSGTSFSKTLPRREFKSFVNAGEEVTIKTLIPFNPEYSDPSVSLEGFYYTSEDNFIGNFTTEWTIEPLK